MEPTPFSAEGALSRLPVSVLSSGPTFFSGSGLDCGFGCECAGALDRGTITPGKSWSCFEKGFIPKGMVKDVEGRCCYGQGIGAFVSVSEYLLVKPQWLHLEGKSISCEWPAAGGRSGSMVEELSLGPRARAVSWMESKDDQAGDGVFAATV